MMYDTLTSHPLVPAGDIEVVLLGVEGSHITCKMSDLQGTFIFPELDYGTYQLFPDVAGIPVSSVYITISEEQPVAEDFSLVISPFNVTYLGISDPESSIESVKSLYPNPAKDVLNLEVTMKEAAEAEVMIIDPSGRCLLYQESSLDKGNQKILLDIGSLSAGFYEVYFRTDKQSGVTAKFIKID
jgi:hypothetical protein